MNQLNALSNRVEYYTGKQIPRQNILLSMDNGRTKRNEGSGLSLDQVKLITHPGEVGPKNESLIGAYALDEFLEEKIEIMQRWCDWLDRLEQKSC